MPTISPIELGLFIALIAAIGWGFTHKAKVAALVDHVELLQHLVPSVPAAAPAVAAQPPTAAPAPSIQSTVAIAVKPRLDATIDPVPLPVTPARNPQSNAPAGFPDTSPGGYPLWYALGGDGKPVGSARMIYDGNTFGTDSEIASYRVAVAQRNLNLAAYQAPAFVGTIAMSSLSLADWCYIDALGSVNWNAVLAGDADVFRAKTIEAYYNGLASFDPASYTGPLKQA